MLRVNPDKPPVIADAEGCDACHHTGRHGRTVIAEVLRLSPELDDMIAARRRTQALLKQARAEGFRSLQEDGIGARAAGEIALADLRRAADMTRGIEIKT